MIPSILLTSSAVVFVGTFFLGESVILSAAALAAQGPWSVWAVAAWALLGTVLSDAMWFTAASRAIARVRRDPLRSQRLAIHAARLDRWTGARPYRALLFIKFVYGTRILSISYLSMRQVGNRRFVTFDTAGTLIWLAVIVPVGYLGGRGLDRAGVNLGHLKTAFFVVVVMAVGVRVVVLYWRRR